MSAQVQQYYDTTSGIEEKYVSLQPDDNDAKYAQEKIAILSIEGTIVTGDGFVKHQIDRIARDKKVKAVVVRVDSPGGTVTGSDFIFHHLKKLKEERSLPLVVSMGSMAASGGYYVAMAVGDQEDSIYAEPTTTTGSIGVIVPHYDLSGLLAEYDVKDDSIASHERKQMLSMTRPIPPEHRELIQKWVNESFERFKGIVKEGRPVFRKDPDALAELATGEIFSADKAKEFGLVDRIGFVEDAIDRARELAHLEKGKFKVVRYKRPADLFGFSAMASAQAQAVSPLEMLLETTTPRAYYLFSTLPSAARSNE
jgi:protease-4